jgi:hypothetical protein
MELEIDVFALSMSYCDIFHVMCYCALQLRANLVSLYGLQSGEKVSLEFDGEAVKDAQCPADLDVEDENIIDVKVSAVLWRLVAAYSKLAIYNWRACFPWLHHRSTRRCMTGR